MGKGFGSTVLAASVTEPVIIPKGLCDVIVNARYARNPDREEERGCSQGNNE